MKIATVSEAKNKLSALLAYVRGGSSVLIVDRGRPVARLEPVTSTTDADARLSRLQRNGLIRVADVEPPVALISETPPKQAGAGAVAALLEQRREGR